MYQSFDAVDGWVLQSLTRVLPEVVRFEVSKPAGLARLVHLANWLIMVCTNVHQVFHQTDPDWLGCDALVTTVMHYSLDLRYEFHALDSYKLFWPAELLISVVLGGLSRLKSPPSPFFTWWYGNSTIPGSCISDQFQPLKVILWSCSSTSSPEYLASTQLIRYLSGLNVI